MIFTFIKKESLPNRALRKWFQISFLVFPLSISQAYAAKPLVKANKNDICVGNGNLTTSSSGMHHVNFPQSRIYIHNSGWKHAKLTFIYLGNSTVQRPLGSGEFRQQLGFRLPWSDFCNNINVMWQFGNKPAIAVSHKKNVGMSQMSQCSDKGHVTLFPTVKTPVPSPQIGSKHTLEARVSQKKLQVFVDNQLVWTGPIPSSEYKSAVSGIRSDNVKYDFEFSSAKENDEQSQTYEKLGGHQCLIMK